MNNGYFLPSETPHVLEVMLCDNMFRGEGYLHTHQGAQRDNDTIAEPQITGLVPSLPQGPSAHQRPIYLHKPGKNS